MWQWWLRFLFPTANNSDLDFRPLLLLLRFCRFLILTTAMVFESSSSSSSSYYSSSSSYSSKNYGSTRDVLIDAGAGATAGAIAATFVCPLDVIKTRLQVHGLLGIASSRRCGSLIVSSLEEIIKNEGLKGMYRGLSPTILALIPTWAVYFPVYNSLKNLLQTHVNGENQPSISANIVAASGAGAATAIITNPVWVVKTRFQTLQMRSGVVPYENVFSALRRIAYKEGFKGLYSGLLPSLAGIAHVAIQFPTYERAKCYFANRDNTTVEKLSAESIAASSSVAKVLASTLTYPHEVVRSRLQEQGQGFEKRYDGVIDCIRKVFQKEGIPGFYRGCATNLLRTTPAAIITFTSYEMIGRFLKQHFPTPASC